MKNPLFCMLDFELFSYLSVLSMVSALFLIIFSLPLKLVLILFIVSIFSFVVSIVLQGRINKINLGVNNSSPSPSSEDQK